MFKVREFDRADQLRLEGDLLERAEKERIKAATVN
jgi:hypothetical protein